jgi:hypothetical protein
MAICLQCNKEIAIVNKNSKQKKFCNRSCAGTYNNSRRIVNPEWFDNLRGKKALDKVNYCKNCNSSLSSEYTKKYCSDHCKQEGIRKIKASNRKKSIIPLYPFNNDTYYCYLSTSNENRKIITFYHKSDTSYAFGMSYSRYLMTIHLGRILEDHEHVDHINNDKSDDRIENYQILSASENSKKFVKEVLKGRKMLELICSCGSVFVREKRLCKGKKYVYCSKECGNANIHAENKKETEIIKEYRIFDEMEKI